MDWNHWRTGTFRRDERTGTSCDGPTGKTGAEPTGITGGTPTGTTGEAAGIGMEDCIAAEESRTAAGEARNDRTTEETRTGGVVSTGFVLRFLLIPQNR